MCVKNLRNFALSTGQQQDKRIAQEDEFRDRAVDRPGCLLPCENPFLLCAPPVPGVSLHMPSGE